MRPEIRCPHINWITLRVKRSAGREIEILIPVHQRALIVWTQHAAIAHLAR